MSVFENCAVWVQVLVCWTEVVWVCRFSVNVWHLGLAESVGLWFSGFVFVVFCLRDFPCLYRWLLNKVKPFLVSKPVFGGLHSFAHSVVGILKCQVLKWLLFLKTPVFWLRICLRVILRTNLGSLRTREVAWKLLFILPNCVLGCFATGSRNGASFPNFGDSPWYSWFGGLELRGGFGQLRFLP